MVPLSDVNNDIGQAKSYAEDLARKGVSRQIETKTGSLISQYNQATTSMGEAISETNRKEVSQSASKLTLNGSVPEKSDIIGEQFYSLVCLKPGALTGVFENMEQLSEAQRTSIISRSKEAEAELKTILENYDEL